MARLRHIDIFLYTLSLAKSLKNIFLFQECRNAGIKIFFKLLARDKVYKKISINYIMRGIYGMIYNTCK